MKKTASEDERRPSGSSGPAGGYLARVLTILGVNAALVIAAALLAGGRKLPVLDADTLALSLLPVSAAMGLILACRRIDFSLPMILLLAVNFPTAARWLPADSFLRLLVLVGVCGGIGLTSALVTWYGRIASGLWTALLTLAAGLTVHVLSPAGAAAGTWPWPWALAVSLGLIVAGAAVLGATGLVCLPSTPPIMRTGSEGLAGLAGAWVLAGGAIALAAQSNAAPASPSDIPMAYPCVLAAGILGGAVILRGRWGALAAVVLTSIAHGACAYAWSIDVGSATAQLALLAGVPLAGLPLYLVIDWIIRRWTGESAPTGLLA